MTIRLLVLSLFTLSFFRSIAQEASSNQTLCINAENWSKLPAHPRLFASEARISAIKEQRDEISIKLMEILRHDVENKLNATSIVYPEGISTMGTSRNVQGRILALALYYRLTGDKRCLEKARIELLQLSGLKNWGTAHFLDVGEAALAAGIGYDWLYHQLTTEERLKVAAAIKNNAIIPALEAKEGEGSWIDGNFNWNPVCNGGVMVGALAIAETEPELARRVTDRAIKNIPYAGEAYALDGAFPEGPSYWAYGTSFYVIAVEALRTVFGTSCNLERMPGFLKTADYNNQMVGATGEDYNYSDYHTELQNEPIMPWFARELKRPDLLEDELTDIRRYHEALLTGKNAKPGKKVALGRLTPLEMVWWNPSLLPTTATTKAPLHWSPKGHLSMGVMRSSWRDPQATYVAIKGGTPNNSHGHMDAGSFIMEADGVRWALDLGTESYNKMRAAKLDLWNYSQNSSRWTTFRVGPEGHNILRFNSELQRIDGKAAVEALPDVEGVIGNKADMSSLYSNFAKYVYRTVLLHPDRSVSIQDEWATNDKASEIAFQWLTKAKVSKTPYGLLLEQNGQSLQLKIDARILKKVTIEVEDVSVSKRIQDSDNPGLSRIIIKTRTPANSGGQLLIRAYPGSALSKSNRQ
ncbi:MAG: heparinase II/III family protein [Chitinophagaceae bacterium]|nr:heparinase II/III family protein [Chitinophagaceae bacterium]